MIYGIIWFGSAWVYWLVLAALFAAGIGKSVGAFLFIVTQLPAIIFIVDIVATVLVHSREKEAQKEEYNREKHFQKLGIITGLVLATVGAYLWLIIMMFQSA